MSKRHAALSGILLSALLAALLGGCASLGKKPADNLAAEHNAAVVEEGGASTNNAEGAREEFSWGDIMRLLERKEDIEEVLSGRKWMSFRESQVEYRQWTDERGVYRVGIKGEARHPLPYVFEIHPDGRQAISYGEVSGRKNPLKMVEEKPGSHVYLIDVNGNGVFDRRATLVYEDNETRLGQSDCIFEKKTSDGAWELEEKINRWVGH
ncbi:MAG: hypothetical protein FWG75_03900 [Cystobacterineae bacterium]|nr:hypothetical protein [Cystobacterineae bacterium]